MLFFSYTLPQKIENEMKTFVAAIEGNFRVSETYNGFRIHMMEFFKGNTHPDISRFTQYL